MEEYGTQLDLFDLMYDYHKFDKGRPARLIETFAGIGTQKMAFDRLGIDDKCFYKAQQVTSNAQLYKQAGNAIVVDVFAKILESFI